MYKKLRSNHFPISCIIEWVQEGMKIQETRKRQRCLNEWHGMLIKKMLYTRHNLILLVCLIILPMIVAMLNLMFDLVDKGETTEIEPLCARFPKFRHPN